MDLDTRFTAETVARFWSRVKKTRGCWLFQGTIVGSGYGGFECRDKDDNRYWRAHRVSWVLHYGRIPDNLQVCHTCDTPLCVRPDHLWIGTQAQNVTDMMNKGRGTVGPKSSLWGRFNKNHPCYGKRVPGFVGRKHSQTSRKKMSKSQSRRYASAKSWWEHREKIKQGWAKRKAELHKDSRV